MNLVSLGDLRDAADRLQGVVRETPVVPAFGPGDPQLWLKCENLQLAGAFKIRGAYNLLSRLPDADLRRGVITYSSGNHGQGVALAARLLRMPAVIVMPTTAPAIKVEGARGFGAEVIFEGTTSLDRKAGAEREAETRGLTLVPPFDHPHIIAGQGTVGLEIPGATTRRPHGLRTGWRRRARGRRLRRDQAATARRASRRGRAGRCIGRCSHPCAQAIP